MALEDDSRNRGVDFRAMIDAAPGLDVDNTVDAVVVGLINSVKLGLQQADEDAAPIKVPCFPSEAVFYKFWIEVTEDEWLRTNSLIMSFDAQSGIRVIGFILKRDKQYWINPEGLSHLSSPIVAFYSIEQYTHEVLQALQRERGGNA